MTWRERIITARKRGYFTKQDKALARDWATCAAHEASPNWNRSAWNAECASAGFALIRAGGAFLVVVARDEFDQAESLLERIEDLALRFKREA